MVALETLLGIEEVNNHKIAHITERVGEKIHPSTYDEHIVIDHEDNSINIKIQKGPIKEFGHNGVQVDEVIAIGELIVAGLNKNFPCDYNVKALGCLEGALHFLNERKKDRAARGVEGQSKA